MGWHWWLLSCNSNLAFSIIIKLPRGMQQNRLVLFVLDTCWLYAVKIDPNFPNLTSCVDNGDDDDDDDDDVNLITIRWWWRRRHQKLFLPSFRQILKIAFYDTETTLFFWFYSDSSGDKTVQVRGFDFSFAHQTCLQMSNCLHVMMNSFRCISLHSLQIKSRMSLLMKIHEPAQFEIFPLQLEFFPSILWYLI